MLIASINRTKEYNLGLYILNGRFKMTPDCFYIDMHVLPVESCIYALCMNMLSDQIGELQH